MDGTSLLVAQKEVASSLTSKLRVLLKKAEGWQPLPAEVADPANEQWVEMNLGAEIPDLFRCTQTLLRAFGLPEEADRVGRILRSSEKRGLLWRIQDTQYEGQYLVLTELSQMLSNLVFALSDTPEVVEATKERQFHGLLGLLENVNNTFVVHKKYPRAEAEFEQLVESILICSFPKLQQTPTITTPLKVFIPDTGVPEARTLIEYKFLREPDEVSKKVDEINADIVGFRKEDWRHYVFAIYEKGHLSLREKWQAQYESFPNVHVVLVRGF